MKHANLDFTNCIIFLMGIAGTGKRTIGQALAKQANFKFVPNDAWIDPILNLIGDDESVFWELDANGWAKLNAASDLIFSTIAEVSPPLSSFVITNEMLDKDPYHQIFYDKLLKLVKKRGAVFLPVRLICHEEELLRRVQTEERKKYFKTRDAKHISNRVREHAVYYTQHENEMTLDVTHLQPAEAANAILDTLKSFY